MTQSRPIQCIHNYNISPSVQLASRPTPWHHGRPTSAGPSVMGKCKTGPSVWYGNIWLKGVHTLLTILPADSHHERPIGYFLPYKVTPKKLIYSLFCGEKIQKNHSTWVKIWPKIQVKNVRLYVQNDNSYIDNMKLIFTRSRSNFSHLYGSFSLNPNGIFYLYICS